MSVGSWRDGRKVRHLCGFYRCQLSKKRFPLIAKTTSNAPESPEEKVLKLEKKCFLLGFFPQLWKNPLADLGCESVISIIQVHVTFETHTGSSGPARALYAVSSGRRRALGYPLDQFFIRQAVERVDRQLRDEGLARLPGDAFAAPQVQHRHAGEATQILQTGVCQFTAA